MATASDRPPWALCVAVSLIVHAGLLGMLVALEPAHRLERGVRGSPAAPLAQPQALQASLIFHVDDATVVSSGRASAAASEHISSDPPADRIATREPQAAESVPGAARTPAAQADLGSVRQLAEQRPPEPEDGPTEPVLPAAGIAQAPAIPAVIRSVAEPLDHPRAESGQMDSGAGGGGHPGGASGSAAGGGGPGSAGAIAAALDLYAQAVRRRVDEHKRYPARARRRSLQGTATITLVIAPGGQLTSAPRLTRSSGVASLDREAMRMVQAAAPFTPSGARAPVAIEIPVQFSMPR